MNSVYLKIKSEKDKLANFVINLLIFFGGVALLSSVYRMKDLGWLPIMWIHLSLWVSLITIAIFRKKIPINVKIVLVLVLFEVIVVGDLYVLGILGNSQIFSLMVPVIATTLLSTRFAIIAAIVNSILLILTAILVTNNIIIINIDPHIYTHSISSWVLVFVVTILNYVVSITFIGRMNGIVLKTLAFLSIKNRELEEANTSKNKLFSVISHDLRSPFIGLINVLQLFCDNSKKFSEQKKNELIRQMLEDAKNVHSLLENLLTWSSLQKDNIPITRKTIKVNNLIEECLALYKRNIENKKIEIMEDFSDGAEIFADNASMRIVISNLLNNAIKFTKTNGLLTLSTHKSSNTTTIWIADTGIGINKDALVNIFHNTDYKTTFGTNNEKGSGLGLGLCKDLVEKNGGTIWVESEEGEGSTFYISLSNSE